MESILETTTKSDNAVKTALCHVVILTFNSELTLAKVIESCRGFENRILVVDSFSKDRTVDIAKSYGCDVVQHEFENYSRQRNWAQEYLPVSENDWILHLDSDEVVSDQLSKSIALALRQPIESISGYLMQRQSYFLGKPIKYGQINPSWHLRLYRAGTGFCEERLYDQHFVVEGKTTKLLGLLLDLQMVSIEQWTAAHNRWSTAEAIEATSDHSESERQLKASLLGDLRMKKRWVKNVIWYKCPLFVRPFMFFFWSYFIRLGFLDGTHGLVYHVLQSFWFRFLVDSKIYEARESQNPMESITQSKLIDTHSAVVREIQ